jgi:RNA polymerase sigma factor (sigma-70 family)
MPLGDHPRKFPSTHWSIIVRLKSSDEVEARKAMDEIFTSYRYPLYAYLRASGMSHEDAEDVLQGFFTKMLRNDALGDADPARGRLRTFLLTALSRFRSNWQRSEKRRQKHVRTEAEIWDAEEARYQRETCAANEQPDRFYDRQWAAEIIEQARQRLRLDYEKRGRSELHAALAPLVVSVEQGEETFLATAARLGLTGGTLRVALHRLRKDFRDHLLHEVQRTLDPGEDARAEIQRLLHFLE